MTPTPVYTQTPKGAAVALSTIANTNTDGITGTYTTIFTAGANGSKVEHIRLVSAGTGAEKVRLFVDTTLYGEYLFAAVTPSSVVASLYTDIDCTLPGNTLTLTSSSVFKANVNNGSNTLKAYVAYGDY